MAQLTSNAHARPIGAKTLVIFLAISFGLTWELAAILMLFYDQVVALFGEITMINHLFILTVYAPGIAGVLLVLWHYGLRGLGSFFRRLTLWRAPLVFFSIFYSYAPGSCAGAPRAQKQRAVCRAMRSYTIPISRRPGPSLSRRRQQRCGPGSCKSVPPAPVGTAWIGWTMAEN